MSNTKFLALVGTIISLLWLILYFDSYNRCVAEGRMDCGVARVLGVSASFFF